MENQHRRISGYRELTQTEIDLMNEIKALGPQIEDVVEKIKAHNSEQRRVCFQSQDGNELAQANHSEIERLDAATPERFSALAEDKLQTGLMYLTRAVAQPTSF
jgi:ABC-type Fe2+-enterobactin transport system substrate-binding protein